MNLVNEDVLQNLRQALSKDDLNALLRQCRDHVIADSLQFQHWSTAANWREAGLLAHRLAGAVANFGCEALTSALLQIEAGLREDPIRIPDRDSLRRLADLASETAKMLEEAALR